MHGAFKAHAVYPYTSSLILTCWLYNMIRRSDIYTTLKLRSISSVLQGYKVDIGKLFTNRPKDKGLKQDIYTQMLSLPANGFSLLQKGGRVEIATIPVCQEVI
jgi:hypothetical protein